ncbi:MAG TPA: NAD(P)-binding domain-containing protein [Pseudonocardiaceae bacterium]|nr:NAD(P)-binding domain-containing protein [Pseudonocardiaceae bacterium]
MSNDVLDYLVVGAGPAGLQLGYFLERAGSNYLVTEAGATPGTFFRTFPRHRTLISVNKVHTGWDDPELDLRVDWNSLLSDDTDLRFTRYSPRFFPGADDLVGYLGDFAGKHGLRVRYDTRITRIARPDGPTGDFVATDQHGVELRARRVVMATGVTEPHLPDFPGVELAEPYPTVTVDPQDFVNQRVLVVGKGNSAFETADNLMETAAVIHVAGPHTLKLAWRTHFVGHLRAINNNMLDAYQLKLQHAVLDGNIKSITRDGDGYRVTFGFVRAEEIIKDIHYDRVILCTGFRFDASIFAAECQPELAIDNRFPAQTTAWESTSVPDLYFAGTITQVRDFKKCTSAFIHGFRYGVRALHKHLAQRYQEQPWPHETVVDEPSALTEAVLARVNRSSGLFQQFGFLADLVVRRGDGTAAYYEEVPADYVGTDGFQDATDYFLVTLEYGPDHDKIDPFDVTVRRITQSDAEHADEGHYIHPVVRHYRDGELVGTHHLTENLENEWDRPLHRNGLTGFLRHELTPASV